MTFGGALVMFGRFVVGVLAHAHANLLDRVATCPKRRGGVIVPISIGEAEPLAHNRGRRDFNA
jgi:hypothetical protein